MSESYTNAAIKGCGNPRKLVKGSPEAKAYMAHLRSLRTGTRAGKKVNGGFAIPLGVAAKAAGIYANLMGKYIKGWHEDSTRDKAELKRLQEMKKRNGGSMMCIPNMIGIPNINKKLITMYGPGGIRKKKTPSGGAVDWQRVGATARDIIAGPLGWIRLGVRRSREKQIAALQKEAKEKGWK